MTSVEVVDRYTLRLGFADGTVGDVDMERHLWGLAFEPLRDPASFAQASLDSETGTVVWPNGADWAPEELYQQALRHLADRARQPSEGWFEEPLSFPVDLTVSSGSQVIKTRVPRALLGRLVAGETVLVVDDAVDPVPFRVEALLSDGRDVRWCGLRTMPMTSFRRQRWPGRERLDRTDLVVETMSDEHTPVAGSKFRRPLTEAEMARIEAAAKRTEGEEAGYQASFRELWDVLLGDAEGVTMAEVAEAGLQLQPAEYAIPESQANQVLELWHAHPGEDDMYTESRIAQRITATWLNAGPAPTATTTTQRTSIDDGTIVLEVA